MVSTPSASMGAVEEWRYDGDGSGGGVSEGADY